MTERIEPSERRGITNIAGGDGMKDEDQAVFTRERYNEICKKSRRNGHHNHYQIPEGSEEYKGW